MKLPKFNQAGVAHYVLPLFLVVAVAGIGTYTLTRSHAQEPSIYGWITIFNYKNSGKNPPAVGALVTVHNNKTGANGSTHTDSGGYYRFSTTNGVTYGLSASETIQGVKYCISPKPVNLTSPYYYSPSLTKAGC